MTVQPDMCRNCSETTLLVFPRGGSYTYVFDIHVVVKCANMTVCGPGVRLVHSLARAEENVKAFSCIL